MSIFEWDGGEETKEFRLRTTWFGIALLEHRIVYPDGTSQWERWPKWRAAIRLDSRVQTKSEEAE